MNNEEIKKEIEKLERKISSLSYIIGLIIAHPDLKCFNCGGLAIDEGSIYYGRRKEDNNIGCVMDINYYENKLLEPVIVCGNCHKNKQKEITVKYLKKIGALKEEINVC